MEADIKLGLENKTVLVTGGSRGHGREIALGFAAEGAHVAICGRDVEKLQQTEKEIKSYGVRSVSIQCDLLDKNECARVVTETHDFFGGLDVLVNNASTPAPSGFMGVDEDLLMGRIYGKFLASMRCSKAAIPYMKIRGGGRIICMGGGSVRQASNISTGIGNAALANFVKNLSDEVAADQILVNIVHPSFSKTDRFPKRVAKRAKERGISLEEAAASFARGFPIGRVPEPSDMAPLVLFLCSSQASAITGQSIAVDGGRGRTIVY